MYIAEQALSRNLLDLRPELLVLQMKLRDLHAFDYKIDALEQEIECLLLQTDGRLLLTVPGMGVSTAAELFAEIGNVSQFTHAGQLIKKAGTNPIIKQTGGGAGSYRKISKQGNDHLRYVVYIAGKNLCMHNKDLMPFYERLKQRGKHERAIFVAMGNKMLKIAFAMLRDRSPFQSQCPEYRILRRSQQETKIQLRYAYISCGVTTKYLEPVFLGLREDRITFLETLGSRISALSTSSCKCELYVSVYSALSQIALQD